METKDDIDSQFKNAFDLIKDIEKKQKQYRFRAFLKWWWNKLTFRGHRNKRKISTKDFW